MAAHEALYEQLDTEVPVVRGDWLLATATKAPLYDELVDLPNTIDQLAARLGIDINDDINHPGLEEPDNLVRVGFRRSGIMLHNRMVERHLGDRASTCGSATTSIPATAARTCWPTRWARTTATS